jgi:hypothetical protein
MIRTRITTIVAAVVIAAASAAPALAYGERKNEAPFIRSAVAALPVSGEPKNEPPFTNPVGEQPTIVLADTSDPFSWIDALIGAAAGVGITCAAAGLGAFAWASRRNAATVH